MLSDPAPATPLIVVCQLDPLLKARSMTLTALSQSTGITMANLSILKNNKAKAVRMSTIAAVCAALDITPGTLFTTVPGPGAT